MFGERPKNSPPRRRRPPGGNGRMPVKNGEPSKLASLNPDRIPKRRGLHLREIREQKPKPKIGTVGGKLKAAREAADRTLESVAAELRIRPELLKALEDGRYDSLPGKTYAIGFVRSYAKLFKLDQEDMIQRFKEELSGSPQADEVTIPAAPEEEARLPQSTVVIVVVLLLLAVLGGWYFTRPTGEPVPGVPAAAPAPGGETTSQAPAGNLGAAPLLPTPRPAEPAAAGQSGQGAEVAGGGVAEPNLQLRTNGPAEEAAPEVAQGAGGSLPGLITALTGEGANQATSAETTLAQPAAAPSEGQGGPVVEESPSQPAAPEPETYSIASVESRITLRVRSATGVRVQDAQGRIIIEREMRGGDTFQVPDQPGLLLVTRDAGAIELIVDGQSVGRAGRNNQVTTGFPLNADELKQRLN